MFATPLPEYRVRQRLPLALLVTIAFAGCSSGGGAGTAATTSAAPAASAERSVQDFMQAVADSNLAKMAQLWGSAKGPAATTHEPVDYERRIMIIQAYLRGSQYRILSNDADPAAAGQRLLQVEITRPTCQKIVPFSVLRAGDAWLVNRIDLTAAGSPGRPCDPTSSTSP
jgi:hypothetical protein